jgi:phage tail protein X
MWDMIAYKVYGKEAYISKLLEANEDLKDIAIFPAGVSIICPEADPETSSILPPWRR